MAVKLRVDDEVSFRASITAGLCRDAGEYLIEVSSDAEIHK